MRQTLADIFDLHPKKTPLSRAVNTIIYMVILLSTVGVILESLPLMVGYKKFLESGESIILGLFVIELVLRISVNDIVFERHTSLLDRTIIVFYYVIDIAAIIPPIVLMLNLDHHFDYFISLRLLRVFKLFRHDHSVEFIVKAILKKKHELFKSAVLVVILTVFLSVLLYEVENDFELQQKGGQAVKTSFTSILISLVWSLDIFVDEVSGYVSFRPVTTLGQLIAGLIGFMKIAIVVIPTGIIATGFIEVIEEEKVGDKYDLLRQAFRKKYNRRLNLPLHEHPHTLLTVKNALNMSEQDIYAILEQRDGFRIRSVMSSTDEFYNDVNMIEYYGYGELTPYGARMQPENSKYLIVCPNNFEDPGMSYLAYCLAEVLESHLISNEKYRRNSLNPDFNCDYLDNTDYFNFIPGVTDDKKSLKKMDEGSRAFYTFMSHVSQEIQDKTVIVMLHNSEIPDFQVLALKDVSRTCDLLTWLAPATPEHGLVLYVNAEKLTREQTYEMVLQLKEEVYSKAIVLL